MDSNPNLDNRITMLEIPKSNILKSNIVNLELLRKIKALSQTSLDPANVIIYLDTEEFYYLNDSFEEDKIYFDPTGNEANQYDIYFLKGNVIDGVAQSTAKTKKLINPNAQNMASETLNKVPIPIVRNSKAAFAKMGILLTVSILAALLLATIILLFK